MIEKHHDSSPEHDPLGFLAGGGEMGERTRTFDWSTTPLGPVAGWPQSLKIAVRIMLGSRYAMWLGWGPDFTFFYNDAYAKMTLGPKHPWALGRSAREVWSEIWADIGPRAEKVIATGEATWDEGLLLFLERRGFKEESYHTFSYSPIPGDTGGVGGMLCVVTEDTERRIGERRLRTLRELAARTTEEAKSAEDACQTAARTLAVNPHDLAFALIYLLDADAKTARLVGTTGLPDGSPAAPLSVELTVAGGDRGWPFRAVLESGHFEVVGELDRRFGPLPGGVWPEAPQMAVVVPMAKPGQARPTGFVVAGVSPRLVYDDAYKGFLELLAGHVATAVSNARAYEEERQRVEQLAALDRAKTTFFSNVSHEFRTPLTLMLGPVGDMLARSHTDLPPAAAAQLEVVNRNGLRLLRLVNSLLDFSRIEAGRVRASYQPTDLAAFTADLASVFRAAVERAGLRLVVDCPKLAEPVFVDRDMWEKVVLNLLSNAFKFTFEGEIAVSLRQAGEVAELRVRDTGTGIPAEEMPKLFERFHRVQHARGRTHEGSGIGLALVQELVKLHGGAVTAESVLGGGTTFTVTVPFGSAHLPSDQIGGGRTTTSTGTGASPFVEEALRWLPDEGDGGRGELPTYHEPLPTPYRPSEPEGGDERPLVLVADDNADMRQYVTRLLAEQFRVRTVPDGESALAAARERPPELVLTDVMMPRLDGFGLLRELRADPRTSGLPIIMLSARAGEESRVEGMEAGADDYLVKPFSARELLARVSAHLQIARLRRESERAVRESEQRLRMALTAARMAAWQYDPATDRIIASDNVADLFGLPPGSTLGSAEHSFRLIHPEDVDRHRAVVRTAIEEGRNYVSQFRLIRPDNRAVVWMEEHGHAITEAPDQTVRTVGVVMDITARKQAEEELQEERDRLRVTLASIGDAVIVTDTEGRISFLNGVAESLTGWTNEEAAGRPLDAVFRIVNETTRLPVENPATKALRDGIIVGLANHTVLIAKDGGERPIDDSAAPVRDGEGHVVGCVLVFRDVSERRAAEIAQAERSRLVALRADVSTAVAATQPLRDGLQKGCEALVHHLGVAFARIWTYDEGAGVLVLQASAGQYTDLDGPHSRINVGEFRVGRVAESHRPLLTNDVQHDPDLSDPACAEQEGIKAFAGYPLAVEGRLVGVLATFAREPLTDVILTDFAPLTNLIAQHIDRKQKEDALRESELRYRLVGQAANDAIWDWDLVTNQVTWNDGVRSRFGYTAEQVGPDAGWWIENIHPEDRGRIVQDIHATIGGGELWQGEYRFRRADGSYAAVFDRGRVVRGGGKPVRMVGSMLDLTERKRLEDELRQVASELADANRRKDEFLAMLAHELRNPLAPIRNALQVMKLSERREVQAHARTLVERQLEQMVRLIDDLMDISRITRGKVELRKQRVQLAGVVNSAVETSRPLIDGMGHNLTVTLPKHPVVVEADPTRLAQVFANILNNAAKYSERGGNIWLTVERQGSDVVVSIRDTGIGIPADQLPHIFDMFTQVDHSLERAQGGLGIGLTLVSRLVEMHGGRVEAHSAGAGLGSEFVVRLPVVVEASGPQVAAEPEEAMSPQSSLRILIVDDNRDGADSLAVMLRIMGHDTRTGYDGLEGVEVAEWFQPDVILLDIGLPKLNGYDACRRIREQAWGKKVVLLAVTGWGQDEDRRRSRDAGFDHHLVKPVDPNTLQKILAELDTPKPR